MLKRKILATILLSACGARPTVSPTPVTETKLFAFHSNPWVNLHHFLYVTSRSRLGLDETRPLATRSLADTMGFGRLSADQQAGWASAIDYYTKFIAKRDILFDSSLVEVNDHLASLEGAPTVRGVAGLDTGIAAALERAAPAYRALWWPRHDAANRRWIAGVLPLLRDHGDAVANAEIRAVHRPWSTTPVRVDVSAYTNWAGAYTTEGPSHINVSSDSAQVGRSSSFELLFHEVLHTMDDSLSTALQTSFHAQKKRYYRDPTHPFIFYTAGELTRRAFPGHVPFADAANMWTRNADYAKILPLLREFWQPYLDGKSSLAEAMRNVAERW